MKKIAIIGKGTAGCISASSIFNYTRLEIDWYFDPKSPAQSVGEGSTIGFPEFLRKELDWTYPHIKSINSTFKHGIRKINWGGSGDYVHPFPIESAGIHFNASKFQEKVIKQLGKNVNFIPKEVTNYSNIDADHILDCSGKPKDYKDYNISKGIPVNAAYITQCYWDNPTFDYTLTMARPYGWVFGIPLQNRCSIGYLYNSNINTEDEVKEDIKEIFKFLNITPSNQSNSLKFSNYYKKENFTERVTYNGNASFFLEPLEATSLSIILHNLVLFRNNKFLEEISLTDCNKSYLNELKEIEFMISLHYLAGSKFNTEFWKFAKEKAIESFYDNRTPKWDFMYKKVLELQKLKKIHHFEEDRNLVYGQWNIESYNINIKELDLFNQINNLLKV